MIAEVENGVVAIKVDGERRLLGYSLAVLLYELQARPLHWSEIRNTRHSAYNAIHKLRKKLRGTQFYIYNKPLGQREFIYELRRTDQQRRTNAR